jgi:hypothetical protein
LRIQGNSVKDSWRRRKSRLAVDEVLKSKHGAFWHEAQAAQSGRGASEHLDFAAMGGKHGFNEFFPRWVGRPDAGELGQAFIDRRTVMDDAVKEAE